MPRLTIKNTLLFVVDVQERLLPAMHEATATAQSCHVLARAAGILRLPIIVTEQYPEKLGPTVADLNAACEEQQKFAKKQFSACTAEVMAALLRQSARRHILLCGIEAHVCVLQTALDLRDKNYEVFVARDAISSRTPANAQIGWDRMMAAGAIPTSTESALFELLQTADRPEFKAVHSLIK